MVFFVVCSNFGIWKCFILLLNVVFVFGCVGDWVGKGDWLSGVVFWEYVV